jgi:hypothetical protein
MKALVASIFALAVLGAGAANAGGIGIGAHIGPVGIGIHAGSHHHRHCTSWGGRGHHRYCRHWSH